MDNRTLGLATKLLAKARATDFDAEAAALTERAYRLLAQALNVYDDQAAAAGLPRRRERRHLRDRRSTAGAPTPGGAARATNPPAFQRRRVDWIDVPGRGQVDLRV
jgi:hypothetical protein